MAFLSSGTNSWTKTIDITNQDTSLTFKTAGKYVDKNISPNIHIPGINLERNSNFYISDGINTWNWSVDASGNVTIT